MANLRLSIQNVSKRFGSQTILHNISLDVTDGEFIALLGASGCGKTTLLRLIAGFDPVDTGSITIDDIPMSTPAKTVAPDRRNVSIVFQSYALWPHMTVLRNVGFPLEVHKIDPASYRQQTKEALQAMEIEELATRYPEQLSGGQRQRTALARCLVMKSDLVLLDEPLANLDQNLRRRLQEEIIDFHKRHRKTMIYVTHDQEEALAMADRIVVMAKGHIEQIDTPRGLYESPRTALVATAIGEANLLTAEVIERTIEDTTFMVRFPTINTVLFKARGTKETPLGICEICIRPEHWEIGPATTENHLQGKVINVFYHGAYSKILVQCEAFPSSPLTLISTTNIPTIGAQVTIVPTDAWILPRSLF